jgi:dethiobiotin synthetase
MTAKTSARGVFIAGTDTGVGKTRLVVGMLRALNVGGWRAIGMKPVASGATRTDRGLINDDALMITAESTRNESTPVGAADINPYCFEPAVSPHIAAEMAGIFVDLDAISAAYARLAQHHDAVVVEGTGGWLAPIGPRTTMADVAAVLDLPVVLVVGVRLGCLSHALLTAEAIDHAGAHLMGWVANLIDPAMLALSENLDTLKQRLPAPPLGLLARAPDAARDAETLTAAANFLMSDFPARR